MDTFESKLDTFESKMDTFKSKMDTFEKNGQFSVQKSKMMKHL